MLSIEPLAQLKNLVVLSVANFQKITDYRPLTVLENLESLWLSPRKEVKAIYNRLLELPKLKYGSLFEHPEFYR